MNLHPPWNRMEK